jgi:hypothetical protein
MAERRETLAVFALTILLAVGCSGTPQPVARAGETGESSAKPAAVPPPPTAAAAPAPQEAEPGRDDKPVVVDPGTEDGAEMTLVEAARAERQRRAHASEPVAVINDKTLPQYAAKGQITIAEPKPKKPAEAAPAATADGEPLRDERYWRGRALEIRQRWRRADDDVEELEQKATELRQKFYLENDTFARDNRIKPEWDRVLDKLNLARLEVEEAQKELADLQEEGRAAGVMPGWLREGEEDEPEPEPEPKKKEGLPPAQSIEPPVLESPPPDDRGGLR